MDKKIYKNLSVFSKCSNFFIIELPLGNLYRFCLASFSKSVVLSLFPLSYKGNKLSVKLLKSLYQDILLRKSQRGLYLSNLLHNRSYLL